MSLVFVDSFYYLALLNRRDASHERARMLSQSLRGATVTTAWVLTEVADALSDSSQRQGVLRLVASLRADPACRIIAASQDLFDRGWELYGDRSDKDWSLTDCISFTVMRDLGITEALTGDHHFEQAGFTVLMK